MKTILMLSMSMLSGCLVQQFPAPQSEHQSEAQNTTYTAPVARDGTRLRAMYFTSADGLLVPSGGIWDAQLGMRCRTVALTPGDTACAPFGSDVLGGSAQAMPAYTDSSCTSPAAIVQEGRTARVWRSADDARFYVVGGSYSGQLWGGSDCSRVQAPAGSAAYVTTDITDQLVRIAEQ